MNNKKTIKIQEIDTAEDILIDIKNTSNELKLTEKIKNQEKEIELLQLELKRHENYIKKLAEEIVLLKFRVM